MVKKKAVSNEMIFTVVSNVQQRLRDLPTRDEVYAIVDKAKEEVKEELRKEIRPLSKAVDKDAVTLVKHEKRLVRVESHLSLR